MQCEDSIKHGGTRYYNAEYIKDDCKVKLHMGNCVRYDHSDFEAVNILHDTASANLALTSV